MGVTSSKQRIESKMLLLKLRREQIKLERNQIINSLYKKTGKMIERSPIPEYIDKTKDPNENKDKKSLGASIEKSSVNRGVRGKTVRMTKKKRTESLNILKNKNNDIEKNSNIDNGANVNNFEGTRNKLKSHTKIRSSSNYA